MATKVYPLDKQCPWCRAMISPLYVKRQGCCPRCEKELHLIQYSERVDHCKLEKVEHRITVAKQIQRARRAFEDANGETNNGPEFFLKIEGVEYPIFMNAVGLCEILLKALERMEQEAEEDDY